MELNMQKEQFSFAYVHAVAASAGFAWSEPSVDDDSVDMTLAARGGTGTIRSPKLDIQVKCHATASLTKPTFSFRLERKNYDDLRDETVLVPRILVVIVVPTQVDEWCNHNEHEMALRRSGYWLSLRGREPTNNKGEKVTVSIPRTQLFHAAALTQIMNRIGQGEKP